MYRTWATRGTLVLTAGKCADRYDRMKHVVLQFPSRSEAHAAVRREVLLEPGSGGCGCPAPETAQREAQRSAGDTEK